MIGQWKKGLIGGELGHLKDIIPYKSCLNALMPDQVKRMLFLFFPLFIFYIVHSFIFFIIVDGHMTYDIGLR